MAFVIDAFAIFYHQYLRRFVPYLVQVSNVVGNISMIDEVQVVEVGSFWYAGFIKSIFRH